MVGTRMSVVFAVTIASVGGCKKSDPLYCDVDTPCTAGYAACDLTAACTELRNTCLRSEDVCWDAGAGDVDAGCLDSASCPDETPVCAGQCRTCQTPAECEARDPATPLCRTDGRCVGCVTSNDCDEPTAPLCSSGGVCGQCEDGPDCLGIDPSLTFCSDSGQCLHCEPGVFLGCSADNAVVCSSDGNTEQQSPCTFGCSEALAGCNECQPTTVTCAASELVNCDAQGQVSSSVICPLGCHTSGIRCNDLDPSNGLAAYLDSTSTAPSVQFVGGATINTSTGAVTGTGGVSIPSAAIAAPTDGVAVRVFMVKDMTVTGNVTVTGTSALAIVSDGDIRLLGGRFSLAGRANTAGPGAFTTAVAPCGFGTMNTSATPGGGGGGFGGAGVGGGRSVDGTAGAGGASNGLPSINPLRGGCTAGGSGYSADGKPGGALQLASRTRISFQNSSYIDATGGGGRFRSSGGGGGGGGPGGGILLEAPVIEFVSGTGLTANGGGGGCKATVGSDGALSASSAAGADCISNSDGDGGQGGSRNSAATAGAGSSSHTTGGGGGGGAGRIRINRITLTEPAGTIISPAPSLGSPAIR